MRGRKIMYASVCILLIGSIFLFQYFYISGKEIRFASEIGGDCTVTVSKYRITEWREREEQLLDGQQIQELKELILSSSFTRILSETVRHDDDDFYDISVVFDFQQEPLVIHGIGNEYIYITGQFGGKHLKINNEKWKECLERICFHP